MSNPSSLENGRAKFAYDCAEQIITLSNSNVIFKFEAVYNEFCKKDKTSNKNEIIESFTKNPKEFYKDNKECEDKLKTKIINKYLKDQDEYKSYAKNIPMLIKTNGIGATFAFIKSKKKTTYDLIYEQTQAWLKQENCPVKIEGDLLHYLVNCKSPKYRAVSIEVLAWFNWLRRFADGLIEDKPEKDNKNV